MEIFSALLAICAGNSPVTGELPAQRPVTRSFDVFFDLCLNKRLSKQWLGLWFETPLHPLWRHCNGLASNALQLTLQTRSWQFATKVCRTDCCFMQLEIKSPYLYTNSTPSAFVHHVISVCYHHIHTSSQCSALSVIDSLLFNISFKQNIRLTSQIHGCDKY